MAKTLRKPLLIDDTPLPEGANPYFAPCPKCGSPRTVSWRRPKGRPWKELGLYCKTCHSWHEV